MKIGLILECVDNGPDQKVCEHAVERLVPGTDTEPFPLGNKKKLIANCGWAAKALLNDRGCDRVIIVWDLFPAWNGPPSARGDEAQIQAELRKENVPLERISLICIEQELEAWLLADERALLKIIPRPTHPVPAAKLRIHDGNPDTVQGPKERLKQLFRIYGGRTYNSHIHADHIAQAVEDCTKMRRSPSFRRFAKAVTGKPLRNHC